MKSKQVVQADNLHGSTDPSDDRLYAKKTMTATVDRDTFSLDPNGEDGHDGLSFAYALKSGAGKGPKMIEGWYVGKDGAYRGPDGRELTAREVNKITSHQIKLEKKDIARRTKNVGTGVGALTKVQKKYPGNPLRQISAFLGEYAVYAGTGLRRQVSDLTLTRYRQFLRQVVIELKEERAAISNLGELNKKLALVLIKRWSGLGETPAVIQNKISKLRCFLTWIGRESAIPTHDALKEWLADNGVVHKIWAPAIAQKDRSWIGNGIDFKEVIERVRAIDGLTAVQLEVQRAFGLRMSESVHMNPKASDYGSYLRVVYGAKGGRPRDVPMAKALEMDYKSKAEEKSDLAEIAKMDAKRIEVEFSTEHARSLYQREVIEKAKAWGEKNRRGVLAHDGLSFKQAKDRFYYIMKKAGITKAALGVTPHGLRHEYNHEVYEEIAGFAPPVSRRASLHVTDEVEEMDKTARKVVSNHSGHNRPSVTQAYTGSVFRYKPAQMRRIKEWVDRTDGSVKFHQIMRRGEVIEAWLGGNAGNGIELLPFEKIRMMVRFGREVKINGQILVRMAEELGEYLRRAVDLSPHIVSGPPDDALNVYMHSDARFVKCQAEGGQDFV